MSVVNLEDGSAQMSQRLRESRKRCACIPEPIAKLETATGS